MALSTRANFYLVLITAIWGLTFPLIRGAISYINPFLFVCIRFALAAMILLPLISRQFALTYKRLLLFGLVLGLLNSAAYIAQTIGLATIHSGRSAFITGFSVVLVPFLLPLFRLGKPRLIEIISALLCLAGLYVLTGADVSHVSNGDIWTLASAILFALSIASVHYVTRKVKEYRLLTFYQILFTIPLALICSPSLTIAPFANPTVVLSILFCAIFATSLALLVQMKYQPLTTAPKAALIYALEPFFASLFGFLLNKEPFTAHILSGGIIILLSLTLPELRILLKLKLRGG